MDCVLLLCMCGHPSDAGAVIGDELIQVTVMCSGIRE
jgi:hypothetical protein